ncbi:unnamed protein product, partial [Polarella glacialis]
VLRGYPDIQVSSLPWPPGGISDWTRKDLEVFIGSGGFIKPKRGSQGPSRRTGDENPRAASSTASPAAGRQTTPATLVGFATENRLIEAPTAAEETFTEKLVAHPASATAATARSSGTATAAKTTAATTAPTTTAAAAILHKEEVLQKEKPCEDLFGTLRGRCLGCASCPAYRRWPGVGGG